MRDHANDSSTERPVQAERTDERVRAPSRRGFAGLDPARRQEIARMGGLAAHAMGLAHEFTPQEGRAARAKSLQRRCL